ncbi:MAG: EAL domain-containing protein, partial [Methylophaga sp.]|nr:EAL domain-containing protein [Methylophaga sp.]
IRPLSSERDIVSQVVSGEIEYAVGGSGILAHYANGSPIKALAAIFQHDALIFIAHQSSGIISPYEMVGKRILFDGTTGDDAPLRAMLAYADIDPSEYTHVAPDFSAQKLIDKQVDVMSAYITDQPFSLKEQGIDINIINPQNYGFDFYGDVLYTSQLELDGHPGRAERFRRASLKGWEYALANSEELIQLLKNKYKSSSTIDALRYEAKETRKLILPDMIPIGNIEGKRLRRVADTYADLGIAKPLDDNQLRNFILTGTTALLLSKKEKLWLAEHPIIRVGVDRDFAPYEWVDEQGNYVGLAAEYMKLIEAKLGSAISFEIVYDKPWHEIKAMAESGELDLLSCLNSSPERDAFLNFTASYVSNPLVIVNANQNGYIGSLKKLSGKTIAVERGYFTHEKLLRQYPDINLIVVDSTNEALTKVATGEADAYFGDAAFANYAIKKANLLNLQFAGETEGTSAYRVGVIKSHPELFSIINKALDSIGEQQRAEIEQQWMGITVETGIAVEAVVNIAFFIAIIILLFLIRHYQLSKEKRVLQAIKDELQLYGRVFSEAHEGILITDENGIMVDVNPKFCEITGYSREESVGKNPSILGSGKHSPEFYEQMWMDLLNNGHWNGEVWNRKKNGELYAELLTLSVLKDSQDKIKHFVGLFSDITQNKQQQETLELMAHYDVLTQLPNRTLFVDRFSQAIAHSKRKESLLAVCFIDLDNFKPVNDMYGHEVGDQLLIEVAKRIQANIREEDTVSRQGGDEFAMLLGDIDSFAQCAQMLDRIHHSLAQPYLINNLTITIGASSGVTLYPLDDGDIDTLIRHADQAMYQAKLAGKNRYHLFNAEKDQQTIKTQTRLQEIQHAFVNNEFCLFYQPKVNMKTGEIFGAEALIRWLHPEKGIVPPFEFLPVIEDTDLEFEVGDWVITEALRQVEEWQQQGVILEVSINISSRHLQSPDFFTQLDSALARHPKVDSNYLQLEILESSALGDLQAVSSIIKTCREVLGVNIALDDFGTGYSSLTHLRNLSANIIKIDQSFVRDMLDDPSDYAIIDGVIGLADSFNRGIIAEGVETSQHGLMLLLMGCDRAQGYGIARPMPADDIISWLESYVPNNEWIVCGSTERTAKERKIKLLMVMLEYWFSQFEQALQATQVSDELSRLVNHKKSHRNSWIERARQELLFDSNWLSTLAKENEDMDYLVNKLNSKYQSRHNSDLKDDIAKLEQAYEKIRTTLLEYK